MLLPRYIIIIHALGIFLFVLGAPASAQADDTWETNLSFEIASKVVFGESVVQEDDVAIDGDGVSFRLSPQVELSQGNVSIRLRNSLSRVEYFDNARTDRWRNTLRLVGEATLDEQSSLQIFAERADGLSTAEFSRADQWEFGGRLEHSFNRANRIRLGASWRERTYDDSEQTKGSGIKLNGDYRYRFAANHFAFVRGRYEVINSDNDVRKLRRWTLASSYQKPMAKDLRIRPELTYRRLDYPGRLLSGERNRIDSVVTPEISILYSPGDLLFILESQLILRNSSDPAFDRQGYRVGFELIYGF